MDLRDTFLLIAIIVCSMFALRKPQIGLLAWMWLSIMNPHKLTFGFIYYWPVQDGLVAATVLGCIAHWKDRASAEFHPILKVLLAFFIWCALTTVFAVDFRLAEGDLIRFTKTLLLVLLILLFMNKKHWILACFAVFLLSLGFTGVKGGLFTLLTGGGHTVLGPAGTSWGDNNGVSLAMLMGIPVAIAFASVFSRKLFKLTAYGTALTFVFSLLGTQSRGGLVGLVAMSGTIILRSRRKYLALILVPVVLAGGYLFMPQSWHDRMATILTPGEDRSASARLIQWKYAIDISLERPFFGNGFDAFYHTPYYLKYVVDKDENRSVHSNYFQVLGEQGYIGLAMYLAMMAMLVICAKKYSLLSKGRKDLVWASSLVGMAQFSVIGYAANGLTVNLAYLDLYYYIMAFVVLLISQIRKELGLSDVKQWTTRGRRPGVVGSQGDFLDQNTLENNQSASGNAMYLRPRAGGGSVSG